MDFGYGVASAILTIAQKKIVAPFCKFALSRRILVSQAYADNYCTSFKTRKTYDDIKRDMVHRALCCGTIARCLKSGNNSLSRELLLGQQ